MSSGFSEEVARLTASRVRCRVLDDVASIMVHQSFQILVGMEAVSYQLHPFESARLTSIRVDNASGVLAASSEIESTEIAAVSLSSILNLHTETPSGEEITVQREYLVHLENDAEDQWSFTLPEHIVPIKLPSPSQHTQRVPVPNWDMPKVLNPPSLYNRESVGDIVGPAFSGKQIARDTEVQEVEWTKPRSQKGVLRNDRQRRKTQVECLVEIQIEVFASKSVRDLHVTGQAVQKNISGTTAKLFTRGYLLDQSHAFRMSYKQAHKTLPRSMIWARTEEGSRVTPFKLLLDETESMKEKSESEEIEIICVIDRTEEMLGAPLINMRRALHLLLNSLPIACRFNIYGFAKRWSRLFPEGSRKYTKSSFAQARCGVEKMRDTLGYERSLNPVMNAILSEKSDIPRKIILVTGCSAEPPSWEHMIVGDGASTSVSTVTITEQDSPGALMMGISSIEQVALQTGGYCELVTEVDMIDQALLRVLKRSVMHGPLKRTLGLQEIVMNPRDPDTFYGTSDAETLLHLQDNHGIDVHWIPPAAGDRVLELATQEIQRVLEGGRDMLAIVHSTDKRWHVPAYGRAGKAAADSSFRSRPWQAAVESKVDDSDDDSDLDKDDRSDDDSSEDETGEYKIRGGLELGLDEGFDIVSQRLAKAMAHDGRVSWKLASAMLKLPECPSECTDLDLWATLLAMTFVKKEGHVDDPCWSMTLDKSWAWVCGKKKQGLVATLFRHAVTLLDASEA